jgi:protein TonB
MPQRLFQDLVSSAARRPGSGRARALPFSVAFHAAAVAAAVVLPQLAVDQPPVSAAPPPPLPTLHRVVIDTPRPVPPPVREARARRTTSPADPVAPPVAHTGTALSDVAHLGDGEPTDDSRPVCFVNCDGAGEPTIGAVLPTSTGGESDPGPPAIRRAGRDVTPPAKLAGDAPEYPELAKRAHVQGDVVIECTIDPSGRVVNATVTRSNPLFDAAALDAVRSWRYRPTLVDGVPVPVLMTVTVRFHLR